MILVLYKNSYIKYQACHVLGWAIQLTSALHYLHSRDFVHGDIKPSKYCYFCYLLKIILVYYYQMIILH